MTSIDYFVEFSHGCFPISSLQPGILNKILMYILQHKHLSRGKGSQLNSSSQLQQQLKVIDQKVSRSVLKQNRSSPFRPDADHNANAKKC